MRFRRSLRHTVKPAAATAAALVWTALATAAATPVTPRANAVLDTLRPVFTWTVPEGETTTGVFVASKRATSANGAFPAANVVDSQVLSNGETRWSPTRPLFGGAYWWSVKTRDAAKDLYSAPRAFRVRASGRITALRLTRFTATHRLLMTVKWRANTKASKVTLRIKKGSKLLWTAAFSATSVVPEEEHFGLKSWPRPAGVAQGAPLTLTATVQANAFTHTLTRPFRAP